MASLTFRIVFLGESSILDALDLVHIVSVGTNPFLGKKQKKKWC
jgi:hypothetical protein